MKKIINFIKMILVIFALIIIIEIFASGRGLQEVYALDTSSGYLVGDVDNNGYIDAEDARQISRKINGKSSKWDGATGDELSRLNYVADVNKDGTIDAKDETQVLRHINRETSEWDYNIF